MLVRQNQFSEFAKQRKEDYSQRMTEHLRILYPDFFPTGEIPRIVGIS